MAFDRDRFKSSGREERIRTLADNLFKRGLVMTMGSARQMAESMVDTEQRVQKKFEEQKGYAHAALAKPAPAKMGTHASTPEERIRQEVIAEIRGHAIGGQQPVKVHAEFEVPKTAGDIGSTKGVVLPKERPPAESVLQPDDSVRPDMIVAQAVKHEMPAREIVHEPAAVHEPITSEPAPIERPEHKIELFHDELPKQAEHKVEVFHDTLPPREPMPEPVPLTMPEVEETPGPMIEILNEGPMEEEQPEAGTASSTPAFIPEQSDDEFIQIMDDEPVAEQKAVIAPVVEPAPVVPEKPREDLAKKHGVDIFNIFGVKKI